MSTPKQFAVCVQNEGYEGTLELRKIYEVLDDPIAAEKNFVRVVDESGEDYLYPKGWFLALDLSKNVQDALSHLATA